LDPTFIPRTTTKCPDSFFCPTPVILHELDRIGLTINAFACAKQLREAGINDWQANGISEALAIGISEAGGEFATKTDISGLKAEMAAVEKRPTNRIYGVAAGPGALVVAGHGVVIFALIRFLPP